MGPTADGRSLGYFFLGTEEGGFQHGQWRNPHAVGHPTLAEFSALFRAVTYDLVNEGQLWDDTLMMTGERERGKLERDEERVPSLCEQSFRSQSSVCCSIDRDTSRKVRPA